LNRVEYSNHPFDDNFRYRVH